MTLSKGELCLCSEGVLLYRTVLTKQHLIIVNLSHTADGSMSHILHIRTKWNCNKLIYVTLTKTEVCVCFYSDCTELFLTKQHLIIVCTSKELRLQADCNCASAV